MTLPAVPLARCFKHGPTAFCFVLPDGRHLDSGSCCCTGRGEPSLKCPVPQHRAAAEAEARKSAEDEDTEGTLVQGGKSDRSGTAASTAVGEEDAAGDVTRRTE